MVGVKGMPKLGRALLLPPFQTIVHEKPEDNNLLNRTKIDLL
jgi:hypothetical protein